MHRIATKSGRIDEERELKQVKQTPADIVFVSAADTDLSLIAQSWGTKFKERLRITHASPLQHPDAAEYYIDHVLADSKLVILRLLGGKAYFNFLLDELEHLKTHKKRAKILLLPGTDNWDDTLISYGDFSESVVKKLFGYFREGGLENMHLASSMVEALLKNTDTSQLAPAKQMPRFGWIKKKAKKQKPNLPIAWICFYRAWHQTGDMAIIDALSEQLENLGFCASAFYAYTLRDKTTQKALLKQAEINPPEVILTLQSFSICTNDTNRISFLETLACPVLQVPISSQDQHSWQHNPRGLSPSDTAMSIALPEIDGRVMGAIAGFKEDDQVLKDAQWTIKRMVPNMEQVVFIAQLAKNWSILRKLANKDKKIAIILANYPNKDSRLGNGVGLDTPASIIDFLHEMQNQGYDVGDEIPADGDRLMKVMQKGITNDRELSYGKPCEQWLSKESILNFISNIPHKQKHQIEDQWPHLKNELPDLLPIPGKRYGNIFIGIQPQRGYGIQTQAIYHNPTLAPPPEYLAYYLWLREEYKADAIIHFGKHGNLEWLLGRSVGLGLNDYPMMCLGPIPHLYPFIVNNPGEGTQAKRRTSAVIVDHLTPPLTRAGLYKDLEVVERLLEEHAHCETLYPERAHKLEHEIEHILEHADWSKELPKDQDNDVISALGNYLCDIKESQIRSGLHVFGQIPQNELKNDFLLSMLRMPFGKNAGLLHSLANKSSDFDLDTLSITERDQLHKNAQNWIETAIIEKTFNKDESKPLKAIRQLLLEQLLPRLEQCTDETKNLLKGLNGQFIVAGPSGAPTRGRYDVLPTGRNFFSIDPRVIPTPTSWTCGKQMADRLLERHKKDHNKYPKTIALVIWGTSNMRTGGDDIAQALALWGVEPEWEQGSGRLVDFNIIPAHLLGRPRIDVLLRVSGLFRDAFGETMRMLATIPKRLVELDESEELNPIRATWLKDQQNLKDKGVSAEQAHKLAQLRVFSAGPGSYGTGMLPLIEAGNWKNNKDLTDVFLKWGGHAYDTEGNSSEQIDLFKNRLGATEVVHQNQDNREHDILDSDDYFQFQGGLHNAIKTIGGNAPITYHGDSSRPEQTKIRTLNEEFNRVFRSRVLNPRWIDAMKNHGYKGAFEMAATVDYIFGYDATCDIVADYQYEELANNLLLDPDQKEFFKNHNPRALIDATQRLLEANERGMWKVANEDTIENLELTLLELQGQLE